MKPTIERREVEIDTEIADASEAHDKAHRNAVFYSKHRTGFKGEEKLAEAIAVRDEAFLALDKANAKYGGWSRFFIVNNVGGHIHRTMSCSTCYPTTEFGWLPNLSGLTEADAVEEWGGILCSVCFPSAPVEHTNGVNKKTAAEKAFNKAIAEINRTPEGKKVKKADELVRRKKNLIESIESNTSLLRKTLEAYNGNESFAAAGEPAKHAARIAENDARVAKTRKELARAEAKLEAATAVLMEALNGEK
jgi:hypothetical protein